MVRGTTRRILVLAVVIVAFAAAYVSAQQPAPGPDIEGLAGEWRGYASPSRGSVIAEGALQYLTPSPTTSTEG